MYWFSLILAAVIIYFVFNFNFKEIGGEPDWFFMILYFGISAFVLTIILVLICPPEKDFQGSDYETEENLNKVSEFGIKNIKNFKENITLLKKKTEYMLLDEKIKRTEEYSAKEIYINKILNMFYGTDKTDLKKQDMELLELLKR